MEDQGGASVGIGQLTDSNFYIWKQKIQLLLALKDVDLHIIQSEVPGASDSDDRRTWMRGDNKARASIGLSLSDEHLEHVRDCETAKKCGKQYLTCLRDVRCSTNSLRGVAFIRSALDALDSEDKIFLWNLSKVACYKRNKGPR